MDAAWVIGSNGLLGSAVVERLGRQPVEMIGAPIRWANDRLAGEDLRGGIGRLSAHQGQLTIYWCAGAGIPSSPANVFESEKRVFQRFLDDLGHQDREVLDRTQVFFASSAGAVYAGVGQAPYDEQSAVMPLAPYGWAKLDMERALRAFSQRSGVNSLSGRISNLYGPGQDLTKAQGLISTLLAGFLSHKPIQIYVSFDTIRDYLFITDAADLVVDSMQRLSGEPASTAVTKILCKGQGTTIGALIGLTKGVVGRAPLIVQGASAKAKVQTRDLSMESVVWPELDRRAFVPMLDGMGRTYQDLVSRHCVAA